MATNGKQNKTVNLGPFTGAYVGGLWQATAVQDGQEPKYGLTILIPKKLDPKSPAGRSFEILKKRIDEVAIEKFGAKNLEAIKKNAAGFKNFPIRDGDVEKPDKPEFAGMYFISAKSKSRPSVVDRHLVQVTDKDEVWSGCKFVVNVNAFAYDITDKKTGKSVSKGVSVGMNHVLFFEKGERIDNRQSAEETFAEYADGSESAAGEEENALD